MPEITIPLIGGFTQRMGSFQQLLDGKDQYFKDILFSRTTNDFSKTQTVYAEKRPGIQSVNTTVSSGATPPNGLYVGSDNYVVASLGTSTYFGQGGQGKLFINCGGCKATFITEADFNGVTHYLINDNLGNGFFLPQDAAITSLASPITFIGNTNSNTVINGISTFPTYLYVGQALSGPGIAVSTRISSYNASLGSITTTIATSATSTHVTVSSEAIAKIIDPSFPNGSIAGYMQQLNGRAYAMTNNAKIYNSALNNPAVYASDNFITADLAVDNGVGLGKLKNTLVAFGNRSIEFFQDSGNPSNSPLSRMVEGFSNVGPLNQWSYAKYEDKIFFVSRPGGTNYEIYVLDGSTPKPIAPQLVRRIFGSTHTNAISIINPISCMNLNGDNYLFIDATAFTDKLFMAYCLDNNSWHRLGWTSWYHLSGGTSIFALGGTSGQLWYVNTSFNDGTRGQLVFTDQTSSYAMTIQTEPKVLNKGKGFVINSIELLADNQSSGSTTLEISRDDYSSFQTLGSFDLTQRRKRIMRGGYCRNHMILRITDSGNNPWRGQAVVIDYTPTQT